MLRLLVPQTKLLHDDTRSTCTSIFVSSALLPVLDFWYPTKKKYFGGDGVSCERESYEKMCGLVLKVLWSCSACTNGLETMKIQFFFMFCAGVPDHIFHKIVNFRSIASFMKMF